MKNKPQTKPQVKKENEHMQSVTTSRPCTITDSITQSCQEVRKMRDGKILEKSLDQLFSDIEQWCSIFQTVLSV
jgi:phage terminase large subunit-like protein